MPGVYRRAARVSFVASASAVERARASLETLAKRPTLREKPRSVSGGEVVVEVGVDDSLVVGVLVLRLRRLFHGRNRQDDQQKQEDGQEQGKQALCNVNGNGATKKTMSDY